MQVTQVESRGADRFECIVGGFADGIGPPIPEALPG
jgi:hypothetical protein